jgi:hypothetical protein
MITEQLKEISCQSKDKCSDSEYCPKSRVMNCGFVISGEVDGRGRSRHALKKLRTKYPIGTMVRVLTTECKVASIYHQSAPKYKIYLTGDGYTYPCRYKDKIDKGKPPWGD